MSPQRDVMQQVDRAGPVVFGDLRQPRGRLLFQPLHRNQQFPQLDEKRFDCGCTPVDLLSMR